MPYLGKVVPIANTSDIADSAVTSAKIADGTIVDADVNASAAIAKTKLASLNVVDADVNASAAIDATKIANGSVTSTEFQYINTLSSNAQTQITNTVTVANAALPKAGGTMSGTIACADELITRPKFTDYAETHNAIGAIGGGTQDIDITSGNVVSGTVDTGTTTFTFSNPSGSPNGCSFTLILTNGGSQTVNWPASVDWAAATAPTLTASGVDVLVFTTIDGGTIWYGFAAGLAMA